MRPLSVDSPSASRTLNQSGKFIESYTNTVTLLESSVFLYNYNIRLVFYEYVGLKLITVELRRRIDYIMNLLFHQEFIFCLK